MSDFPGGPIKISKRVDGAVRIEFGREVIVVTPHNAVKIGKALLRMAGAKVHMIDNHIIAGKIDGH